MKYSLTKVQDKIWHLTFDCRYDLSMHFLRYQEFYECPNSKFRGKKFTIFEFMKWYSFKYSDGCFEYPIHWAGFNIPIKIFKEIKNRMKNKVVDKVKISYIIHSIEGQENFCYMTACTSKIQL